eukprot:1157483-Pelagomonas_calceolata.AAC.3
MNLPLHCLYATKALETSSLKSTASAIGYLGNLQPSENLMYLIYVSWAWKDPMQASVNASGECFDFGVVEQITVEP